MIDFSAYVIESNGEYYHSLKGRDFDCAAFATIFRSSQAAEKHIRHAIKNHRDYIGNLNGMFPAAEEHALKLIERWETTAKVVKIA